MSANISQRAGAGVAPLPELPEWTKRDDLGGLVPSEVRQSVTALMREAWNRGLNYGLANLSAGQPRTAALQGSMPSAAPGAPLPTESEGGECD